MAKVRLSVKAIVIRDGRLLVLRNRSSDSEWYSLPGGGQEHGETIPDALNRECLEEIGTEVTIGRLRFVRDYIAKHHEFAATDGDVHQVELMFECEPKLPPRLGTVPDTTQTGIAWLAVNTLGDQPLYPGVLKRALLPNETTERVVYLGDVN